MPISSKEVLYDLINGKQFELPLKDDVTYENLKVQNDVLWSFLLYSGYLTTNEEKLKKAIFYIPNYEVREALIETMERWILDNTGGTEEVNIVILSMLNGNEQLFRKKLSNCFIVNGFY